MRRVNVDVERLETPRLVLRDWRASDLEDLVAMSADPEVMRYVGGVLDRPQTWRQLALVVGHWALRGYGLWAVERKRDAALVGRVGLWNPAGWPGLEVGWTLTRHAWGQGYATEAAGAAMQWAWTELNASELVSVIHRENAASIRVAERLGLRPRREGTFKGERCTIWGIDRPGLGERTAPSGA